MRFVTNTRKSIPLSIRRMPLVLSDGNSLPRGIRNNNPGNLIMTSIPWKGKVPASKNTDGKFEQFYKMEDGVRAMLIDLKGDIDKDGLNTITKLIYEYAPPHENDTSNYINLVSKRTGIGANSILQTNRDTLVKVGMAMTGVENGWAYMLPMSKIIEGYNLIGGTVTQAVDTVKRNPIKTIAITALVLGVGYYALNDK